ncbi:MAG: hypothetical protein HZB47_13340 [Nitrosomonadales bacterium]|nr:hypothetical protein [Nitrosomonadales bacterium]
MTLLLRRGSARADLDHIEDILEMVVHWVTAVAAGIFGAFDDGLKQGAEVYHKA